MLLYLDSLSNYNAFVIKSGGRVEQWTDRASDALSGFAVDSSYGRGEGGGIRLLTNNSFDGANSSLYKMLDGAYDNLVVGVAVKLSTETDDGFIFSDGAIKNTNKQIITFTDGYTSQISLYTTPSLRVGVRLGNTGTVLARSGRYIQDDCYHFFEFAVTFSSTTGSVRVRIDGEEWRDLYLTNVNTISTTNASATAVRLGNDIQFSGNLGASRFYFDDWYILTSVASTDYNDFLGDVRIEGKLPSSNQSSSTWEPTSGTVHYTLLNESPQTTTDVDNIRTNTLNSPETFHVSSFSPASGTILAIQPNFYARKDNAGVARIASIVSDGVTPNYAGTFYLGQTWRYHNEQVLSRNPLTNSQWPYAIPGTISFGVAKV